MKNMTNFVIIGTGSRKDSGLKRQGECRLKAEDTAWKRDESPGVSWTTFL
jgi:hypothetical protein